MNLSVHAIVFIGILLFFQTLLIIWSSRQGASAGIVFLTAFVPFVAIPLFLARNRARARDNHVAGALTYLTLIVTAFGFLFWYPKAMEDDIPWALIHTMLFFAFLGLANLVMAPFSKADRWQDEREGEGSRFLSSQK